MSNENANPEQQREVVKEKLNRLLIAAESSNGSSKIEHNELLTAWGLIYEVMESITLFSASIPVVANRENHLNQDIVQAQLSQVRIIKSHLDILDAISKNIGNIPTDKDKIITKQEAMDAADKLRESNLLATLQSATAELFPGPRLNAIPEYYLKVHQPILEGNYGFNFIFHPISDDDFDN